MHCKFFVHVATSVPHQHTHTHLQLLMYRITEIAVLHHFS